MRGLLPLLLEISALADRSDAAWLSRIRAGVCKLMRMMLARNCPMHSPAPHDSRREDCVSICLSMAHAASRADGALELTRTLRAKLHTLTANCICAALQANATLAHDCFI